MPTNPKNLDYETLTENLEKANTSDFKALINNQKEIAKNNDDTDIIETALNNIYTLQMLNVVHVATNLYHEYLQWAFYRRKDYTEIDTAILFHPIPAKSLASTKILTVCINNLFQTIPNTLSNQVMEYFKKAMPRFQSYLCYNAYTIDEISDIYHEIDYEVGQLLSNGEGRTNQKADAMEEVFEWHYPKLIFTYPKYYLPMLTADELRAYDYVFMAKSKEDSYYQGQLLLVQLYQFKMNTINAMLNWWLTVNTSPKLEQFKLIELLYQKNYISIEHYDSYRRQLYPESKRQLMIKPRENKPTLWYWTKTYSFFNLEITLRDFKPIKTY